MPLSNATKMEIKQQVEEGIESAFANVDNLPLPEGYKRLLVDVENNRKFIDGNGHDGAKVTLARIESEIQMLREFRNETKKLLTWILGTAGSAVILAIINLILK